MQCGGGNCVIVGSRQFVSFSSLFLDIKFYCLYGSGIVGLGRPFFLLCNLFYLKGPKHEIFESGFFTEIRHVRIGDLGTGEKK
jgi:hypothetical protein